MQWTVSEYGYLESVNENLTVNLFGFTLFRFFFYASLNNLSFSCYLSSFYTDF